METRRPLVVRAAFLATALVLAASLVVAAGCAKAPAGVVVVNMQGLEFVPQKVTIKKGTAVRWVNKDQDVHSSTAADWQPGKSNPLAWTSLLLNPGQTYERRFEAPGSFDYTDQIHGYMNGNVTVTE